MSKKVVQALLFFVLGIAVESVGAQQDSCVNRADECKKVIWSHNCQAFKDQKLIDICIDRYNHHKNSTKACSEAAAECTKQMGPSNNDPMCNNFYHVCTDCCGFNQNCLTRCREQRETCFHNPPILNPSDCWNKAKNYRK